MDYYKHYNFVQGHSMREAWKELILVLKLTFWGGVAYACTAIGYLSAMLVIQG